MVDSYYQLLIVSYLIGSISSAIIISKALGLPDPRTQGSKNPGATNVLRLGGKKIAAFVLFFDGLKGAVPVFIGVYYGFGLTALTLTALCAFLGHVFPVFFRFRGGKGVATLQGVTIESSSLAVLMLEYQGWCFLPLFSIIIIVSIFLCSSFCLGVGLAVPSSI